MEFLINFIILNVIIQSLKKKGGEFMEDCIFCKIIKGEIPSKKIYEDE